MTKENFTQLYHSPQQNLTRPRRIPHQVDQSATMAKQNFTGFPSLNKKINIFEDCKTSD